MKNLKTAAIALFVAISSLNVNAQESKKIDVAQSKIHWVGKKVTGQHDGTINFQDGVLVFKDKKLAGGNFTVDMTSINTTDLSGKGKENLDGHLKADDFFGVDKYPTATIVFKSLGKKSNNVYAVTADLTIKGITHPVKFDITVDKNSANAALKVDRTKYDIKYKSKNFFEGLGDNVIYDEFELAVDLKF